MTQSSADQRVEWERGGGGWGALCALTERELVRFLRQPSRMIASIGTAIMLWIFLVSGLGAAVDRGGMEISGGEPQSGAYMVAIAPSMATLTILFSSIFGAISLIEDRHSGFLQAALVSPTHRWALAFSKVIGASAVALVQGFIVLLPLLFFAEGVGVMKLFFTLIPLLCVALGISGLSMALAWRVDSVQGFHGVMNLVLMPMWLLSGGVFPLGDASLWLRWIAYANPLTWPTRLMQRIFFDDTLIQEPFGVAWVATIGFGVGGFLVAWRTLGSGRIS